MIFKCFEDGEDDENYFNFVDIILCMNVSARVTISCKIPTAISKKSRPEATTLLKLLYFRSTHSTPLRHINPHNATFAPVSHPLARPT